MAWRRKPDLSGCISLFSDLFTGTAGYADEPGGGSYAAKQREYASAKYSACADVLFGHVV